MYSDNKKNEAYQKLCSLIEKFRENYHQYTDKNYNETETRRDFLDPFFEAFGWDVSNRAGKSQTYRDVIHEDKVKVGKETKAPDYAFRIGGSRVFFVEAKKPGVNLKEDSLPAFQLRRYGWSAKLGISILTDFEELAVYDCTKKPNVNDKASTARIEYIHFEDYLKKFDFLYEILNKERIEQGSLEKYIAGTSNKKGTESVDIDFLITLDSLRTKLASNISKLNKDLSVRDLNYAVQQIIDRIIFLRAAEDRGIEEYGDLKKTCENKNDNFYSNLLRVFEHADGRYNSGLFDFSKDSISSSIVIDNKVIKEIINELYYPLSPYEFSVISVEIMGNAYEQFLGKTITIGKNHSAKIELKPEVRKAGGVYYTPEYIVDYIVKNTVGEAIKGKKPEEIANIKILDPACGSGSFLLGAYKYLLNYHIEYYNKIKDRAKFKGVKEDVIKENGDLTIWIKKQILRNNIFGVDIDSNAVEVTKLSLLMKCLEGESPASIQNNQDLFNERALPSLEDNIKCGNSLIGNDFYESQSMLDFDEETQYKINCFDWEEEFPSIFKKKRKEVQAYHITFVLHNSRVSERMIAYNVSKGEVLNLSEEDEVFISKSIGDVIIKNNIKCLAYNISRDHVHMLLVCGADEVSEIVRKIKGYSSYCFREYLNIEKGEEFHLWAQKFDIREIGSDARFANTIEYINNNRIKHELGENKGLKPLVLSFLSSYEDSVNQYYPDGFDVIIGNPPYVDSEEMVKSSPLERNYCSSNYEVASGNWDLYCVFSEKSINMLKDNGYFGYIIPNKFLSLPYGEHLRLLFSKYHIKNIRDYSSVTVFVSNNKKINVYPIVIILNKTNPEIGVYNKMISEEEIDYQKEFLIDNTFEWSVKFDKEFELIDKVVKRSKLLGDDFIIENSATVSEAYEIKEYLKDDNNINSSFMFINTGTIDRYSILWGINSTQYIKDKYNYPIIEKRIVKSKFPKRYESAIKEKIIAAGMVNKLEFCYDDSSNILSGKSTTIVMNKEQSIYNLKYILGLLNSKLYNLVFKSSNKHNSMSGGYMNVNKNSLSSFIYYPLDMSNKKDKEMHDKIVTLVDNIIALNKKLSAEKNPNSINILKRQINALDKQIDVLVYKLYNLNDDEIKIIEGK